MYRVTMHQAEADLSRLIEQALAGEEVIIARGDTPVVRLVPLPSAAAPTREVGALRGMLQVSPEFFEPLSTDEIAEWEK
jgi:antitoxin (DNA-binding transcriptional repressor) of toxin-antitoxin stability system